MHQPQLGKTDSTPKAATPSTAKRRGRCTGDPYNCTCKACVAASLRRMGVLDEELREIEQTFAYERASDAIENHCLVAEAVETPGGTPWYDLGTRNDDLSYEVHYLTARRLLEVHPEHPSWVRMCDEGEPLPATEGPVQ